MRCSGVSPTSSDGRRGSGEGRWTPVRSRWWPTICGPAGSRSGTSVGTGSRRTTSMPSGGREGVRSSSCRGTTRRGLQSRARSRRFRDRAPPRRRPKGDADACHLPRHAGDERGLRRDVDPAPPRPPRVSGARHPQRSGSGSSRGEARPRQPDRGGSRGGGAVLLDASPSGGGRRGRRFVRHRLVRGRIDRGRRARRGMDARHPVAPGGQRRTRPRATSRVRRADRQGGARVSELRIVRAEGDPVQRGQRIGRELRDLVNESIDFYERYMSRRGVSTHQLQELLTPYLASAESSFPQFMATLKGMSAGATVPFLELFAVNAFEELEPLLEAPEGGTLFLRRKEGGFPPKEPEDPRPAKGPTIERCSSFAVTAPGVTLLGHNEQWVAGDLGNVAVVIDVPDDGSVAVASPTIVSCLPAVGVNGHGAAQE